MPSRFQLDPVVKSIDAAERGQAASEGYSFADPPGSFFQTFGREKKYYRVSNASRDRGSARFEFTFHEQEPEHGWSLGVDVKSTVYFAGKTEAEARKLVDELKSSHSFDAGLQSRILDWLDDFRKTKSIGKTDFIWDFLQPQQQRELRGYICERARTDLRLEFSFLSFTPHTTSTVSENEKIDLRGLKAKLKDFAEVEFKQFEADLQHVEGDIRPYLKMPGGAALNGDRKSATAGASDAKRAASGRTGDSGPGGATLIVAPLDPDETLESRLRKIVQSECRRNVTVHEWQFELQSTVKKPSTRSDRRLLSVPWPRPRTTINSDRPGRRGRQTPD